MTSTSVSDFLSIPRHGNPIYSADPREDALNAVLGTDDSDSGLIITANDLQAEPRLILNVVHRILFLKSGAFEYISDIFIVWVQMLTMPELRVTVLDPMMSEETSGI